MDYMHRLDNIMNYKGQIYFYENKMREIYVWGKKDACRLIVSKINNVKLDTIKKLNPKLKIFNISVNDKIINIIDDSKLLTGTKMRVATKFLKYIINISIY